jgi:hypothetical protein
MTQKGTNIIQKQCKIKMTPNERGGRRRRERQEMERRERTGKEKHGGDT